MYLGYGLGNTSGTIKEDTKYSNASQSSFSTNFGGGISYYEFGLLVMGSYVGLHGYVRSTAVGTVTADEDPFHQKGNSSKLQIDESSLTFGLGMSLRY
jgi:hypothetical protein